MAIQTPIPIQFSIDHPLGLAATPRRPAVDPEAGNLKRSPPRAISVVGAHRDRYGILTYSTGSWGEIVTDDDVIDLIQYRDRDSLTRGADPARSEFSVFGGDGDRSRFALPVWRAIYLVGGRRGSLVWVPQGGGADPKAEFVLDLGEDPARTHCRLPDTGTSHTNDAPTVFDNQEGVAVFLGVRDGKKWFLVLDDYGPAGATAGFPRGDLLFLAGECAGLLFFKELAEAGDKLNTD